MPESSGSSRLRELLEEWRAIDEELRELRRRSADWEYIRGLPPRVRRAVEVYVEEGDLRSAQRASGLGLEEFVKILRRARVWTG